MENVITVEIDDLYLDPNNPRLAENLDFNNEKASLKEISRFQKIIINRLARATIDDEDHNFFEIESIIRSYKKIGFIDGDRIFCRKMSDGKYLVLEGNRRVTGLKVLKERDYSGVKNELVPSLQKIPIAVIKTEGLSEEEISEEIDVLLGIRHYGGLKPWAPLPSAYNIFETYINLDPKQKNFEWTPKRAKETADALSILSPEVTRKLKTLIVYKQLEKTGFEVKQHHFSLIQSIIGNSHVKEEFNLEPDPKSLEISEVGLEKMDLLCQFEKRDSISANQIKLKEPKKVSVLAKVIKGTTEQDALARLAKRLIKEFLEGEKSLESYEDDAGIIKPGIIEEWTNAKRRGEWVKMLEKLIEKKNLDLNIEDFGGTNDELERDRLKEVVKRIKGAFN